MSRFLFVNIIFLDILLVVLLFGVFFSGNIPNIFSSTQPSPAIFLTNPLEPPAPLFTTFKELYENDPPQMQQCLSEALGKERIERMIKDTTPLTKLMFFEDELIKIKSCHES